MAVVVFAIPTGILGSGFQDMIMRRKEAKRELAAQQSEGEDGLEESPAFLAEELAAWSSARSSTGSDRPWFGFLDVTTEQGKVYRLVVVAVVVVDVCTFFTSTLSYLQVKIKLCCEPVAEIQKRQMRSWKRHVRSIKRRNFFRARRRWSL